MNSEFELLIHRYRGENPFKTLWYLFSRDGQTLFLAIFFFFVKHCPVWILPFLTKWMIDSIQTGGTEAKSRVYLALAISVFVIAQNLLTNTIHMHYFTRVVRGLEIHLRGALIRRLQTLSMDFHEGFDSGRMHAKVLKDVDAIGTLGHQILINLLPSTVTLGITLYICLFSDMRVALFFMLSVPIAVMLVTFFRKRMSVTVHGFRITEERVSAGVSEMIQMLPATRAHGAEDAEIQKMDRRLEEVKNWGQRFDMVYNFFGACTWVSFQMFSIACIAFMVVMAIDGSISLGDVWLLSSYFTMIVQAIQTLMGIYPILTKGVESVNSIGEILQCPDLERNEGKEHVEEVRGHFVFEKACYRYPDAERNAVSDIDLDISEGETVALVGASGSGKSTLVNLLIGFRRPTSGRILLDGRDMESLDLRDYRKFISVVSQNTLLFNGSIRDNITYGMDEVDNDQLYDALVNANALEFVETLPQGVDTMIGEGGAKLSGGQRQRLSIARALIRSPKVILLDEATSALDLASEKLVQDALERLIKNRTTIIVAHRLSTIRNADRIVVLEDGKISEIGNHEELLERKGSFYKLYHLQF